MGLLEHDQLAGFVVRDEVDRHGTSSHITESRVPRDNQIRLKQVIPILPSSNQAWRERRLAMSPSHRSRKTDRNSPRRSNGTFSPGIAHIFSGPSLTHVWKARHNDDISSVIETTVLKHDPLRASIHNGEPTDLMSLELPRLRALRNSIGLSRRGDRTDRRHQPGNTRQPGDTNAGPLSDVPKALLAKPPKIHPISVLKETAMFTALYPSRSPRREEMKAAA